MATKGTAARVQPTACLIGRKPSMMCMTVFPDGKWLKAPGREGEAVQADRQTGRDGSSASGKSTEPFPSPLGLARHVSQAGLLACLRSPLPAFPCGHSGVLRQIRQAYTAAGLRRNGRGAYTPAMSPDFLFHPPGECRAGTYNGRRVAQRKRWPASASCRPPTPLWAGPLAPVGGAAGFPPGENPGSNPGFGFAPGRLTCPLPSVFAVGDFDAAFVLLCRCAGRWGQLVGDAPWQSMQVLPSVKAWDACAPPGCPARCSPCSRSGGSCGIPESFAFMRFHSFWASWARLALNFSGVSTLPRSLCQTSLEAWILRIILGTHPWGTGSPGRWRALRYGWCSAPYSDIP